MDGRQDHPITDDVVAIAESMARELHIDRGEAAVQLHFSGGRLRRADVHRGPLRPDELRKLARQLADEDPG